MVSRRVSIFSVTCALTFDLPGYVFKDCSGSQVVLKKSMNKDKDGKIVNEKIVEFANRGYRALGVSKCNEMVSLYFFCSH